MKNLSKIPRNFNAKFCWQEKPKQATEVSKNLVKGDLNTLNQQVKQTPKSNEYSSKKTIDASLTAAKNGEKMPTGFEKIKASEFLKRSAEELQTLFIDNGVVNFRGNDYAKNQIGLADLFPKVSNKPQYVVLNRHTYAYGARRRDGKIGYGDPKYKSILGGETIEFFIGSPKQDEDGKSRENFVSFVKDEKGETTPPPAEYSYNKLDENFAGFYDSKELENLTPAEETATKNEFLQELQVAEKYEMATLNYTNKKLDIPDKSLQGVADALKIDLPAIKAIISVESSGKFSATRFEQHIFNDAVKGVYGAGDPRKLATSYGAFQIMGFNYRLAGFSSVEEMVLAMQDPKSQLEAFANYIKNRPAVHKALQNHDWTTFARLYNGPGYAQNNYDNKIATAFNKFNKTDNYDNLA